jgi:hypothetical protein
MFQTTVVDEQEHAELRVTVVEGEDVPLSELDRRDGEVDISSVPVDDDRTNEVGWTWEFDQFRDARAAYGLWNECGPFLWFNNDRAVPIEVAREGKPAIGTYLYIVHRSHSRVADELDVSRETVSNYLSQMRWDFG